MAIIEIAPGQSTGTKGVEKKIDQRSEKMIMNILQAAVYSYPVESCVRESASNMVDAVDEKIIARNILSGKNKVEEYYIERQGEEYEDSKFDTSYYDLNWLREEDVCRITYREKDGVGYCDSIEFYDTGVGLSPERFLKATGLAFSTKRNTNKVRGGFGMGLKSPLATEIDYFTVESCYNGMKIVANCYKYQTQFVIPKFNLETGEQNPSTQVTIGDDTYIVYYERTTEKNYTRITVPSKKINRSKYRSAVENQLMYINKVEFNYIYEDGTNVNVDFKAKVLYNSNNIIISDNNLYSKPHIIIVKSEEDQEGICYGQLDFKELELEEKYTSVGIKCLIRSVITDDDGNETVVQEGVSVTPSREKVIFNEATKNYLISKFNEVVKEASVAVEKQLKQDELIAWIKAAANIITAKDERSVIGRMGKLVDLNGVSPAFPGNKSIRYSQSPAYFFRGFKVRLNSLNRKTEYVNGKRIEKTDVERHDIKDWSKFVGYPIMFKTSNTLRSKDMFIINTKANNGFVTIEPEDTDVFLDGLPKGVIGQTALFDNDGETVDSKTREDKELVRRDLLLSLVKASADVNSYDDVEVPEDWLTKFNEVENKLQAEENQAKLSDADRRALEEKVVMHYKRVSQVGWGGGVTFTNTRSEIKYKDLLELNNVVYFTKENEAIANELVSIALNMARRKEQWRSDEGDNRSNFKLIMVSEQVAKKYCKNLINAPQAVQRLTHDFNLTTIPMLSNWYTANLVKKELHKFLFLVNSDSIAVTHNPNMTKIADELYEYVKMYAKHQPKEYELKPTLDKMAEFQLFVADHKGKADIIGEKSQEMYGTSAIKDAHVIDMDIWNKLQWILGYAEVMYPVMRNTCINYQLIDRPDSAAIKDSGIYSYTECDDLKIKFSVMTDEFIGILKEFAVNRGVYSTYCNTPAEFLPEVVDQEETVEEEV